MSNDVRDALREAVTVYGTDLGSDARRCRAVLLDWCPRNKREIRVLEATVEDGVPEQILAKRASLPRVVMIESLAKQVYENHGIDLELSRWSVGCWIDALEGQAAKGTGTPPGGSKGGTTARGGGSGGSGWFFKLAIFVVVLGFLGGVVYGLVWAVGALVNGGGAAHEDPKPPAVHAGGNEPAPVKKDPPKVDPPVVKPVPQPAPKPVSPWEDPAYVESQGASAVARVDALRERIASRRAALANSVETAKASRADAASLNVYVPRAFQKAIDEDRWPFRASGYTLTRAQGERLIAGLKVYLKDADDALKQAEGLAVSLDGLVKEADETKSKLLCAIGRSADPGCSGVKPTRTAVEPLIAKVAELEGQGGRVAADPKFPALDVNKMAGAP